MSPVGRRLGIATIGLALLCLGGCGRMLAGGTTAPARLISRRWREVVDKRIVWITAVGPKALLANVRASTPLTASPAAPGMTYLIAVGTRADIALVLRFARRSAGPVAEFYYGKNLRGRALGQIEGTGSTTEPGVSSVVVTPNEGGWLVGGKANFSFTYEHFSGDVLLGEGRSQAAAPGIPLWSTGRLVYNPYPTRGYPRFGATVRMRGAPPFRMQHGMLNAFPLFGIGSAERVNWFVSDPSPFLLDVGTGLLEENSTVGFEDGGVYRFNSISYPPKVDFESPFAFYSFTPSRYASLVVRAQQFPEGDPFGRGSPGTPRSYFRVSWKMANPYLWKYSLSVQGLHRFSTVLHLGKTTISAPLPSSYPEWVTSRRWPYVTFVEAMKGYPGSEGIYFDSGSSVPGIWAWLQGTANEPPAYLQEPALPQGTNLTNYSDGSLPVGFREENNPLNAQRPLLYVSPVDKLVHLWGSRGGLENLGRGTLIKEEVLGPGATINGWLRERFVRPLRLPDGPWPPASVVARIYQLGPYLVYSGTHGVIIRLVNAPAAVFRVAPPSSRATWERFVRLVRPYEGGRSPDNFRSWLKAFSGATYSDPRADITRVVTSDVGVQLLLVVARSGLATNRLSDRFPNQAGSYVLTFHWSGAQWSISPATPPVLDGRITGPTVTRQDTGVPVRFSLRNVGRAPWSGYVVVSAGRDRILRKDVGIPGGGAWSATVPWTPTLVGRTTLSLRAGPRTLASSPLRVSASLRGSALEMWRLSGGGGTAGVFLGVALLAVCVLGGVLMERLLPVGAHMQVTTSRRSRARSGGSSSGSGPEIGAP